MAVGENVLANLPSVNELVEALAQTTTAPRALVVVRAREAIQAYRKALQRGDPGLDRPTIMARLVEEVRRALAPGVRRVINATGVVLHTGLGRAPLAEEAIASLVEVARFCNVQADLEEGTRSLREAHVESLLKAITGCEAATIVNNNAAATLLVLATLAAGREVIVSRGELVEIGGSYRIPDVMAQSGAILVEVGCTNRTHPRDYEAAVTERTVAIMKVHKSNYAIQGFTSEVSLAELAPLAKEKGLLLIHDMGSGSLVDLASWGLVGEAPASSSLREGADLVTFSGDKLVGGPQAGIIIGKAELIGRVRAHPLARAVRVDKLTLAAMEATLRLLLDPSLAVARVPTLRMITAPASELEARARRLARKLRRQGRTVSVCAGSSRVGSGAFPVTELPTTLVLLEPAPMGPQELARRLRVGTPPVFVRIVDDRVALDVRTVFPEEEPVLVEAVREAFSA